MHKTMSETYERGESSMRAMFVPLIHCYTIHAGKFQAFSKFHRGLEICVRFTQNETY
jgi:hypothetical protein